MSYNPYGPTDTATWATEAPPTQVPGWGTDPGMPPMGPPPGRSNTGLVLVLVLLAVAALGAGAFFLMSGGDDDETADGDADVVNNTPSDQPDQPSGDVGPVTTLPGGLDDVDEPTLPDTGGPTVPPEVAAADAGPPEAPPTGDAQYDDLAQECYQGDMEACDDLYLGTPVGSEYEAYGDTCGARVSDSHGYYCVDLLPNPEPPAD